jgi:hypothetical protein
MKKTEAYSGPTVGPILFVMCNRDGYVSSGTPNTEFWLPGWPGGHFLTI